MGMFTGRVEVFKKNGASLRMVSHMDELDDELEDKIHDWLEAIGMDAASTAQEYCPVDTGRLKNSIYPLVVDEELCVYVGSNVVYAPAQEYGNYSHKVGRSHYLQAGCTVHQKAYRDKLKEILSKE